MILNKTLVLYHISYLKNSLRNGNLKILISFYILTYPLSYILLRTLLVKLLALLTEEYGSRFDEGELRLAKKDFMLGI